MVSDPKRLPKRMGNKHLSPGLTKCLGNFKGDQGLILEDEDGIPREVGFAHVPSAIFGRRGLAARIERPRTTTC